MKISNKFLFSIAIFFCVSNTNAEFQSVEPIIDAPAGTFVGQKLEVSDTEGEVVVFKGVRYARPPVGKLRWQEPKRIPDAMWPQIARHSGAACMQPSLDVPIYRSPAPQMSEDCLYLNIYTPSTSPPKEGSSTYPVMIWLHGGSLVEGHADIYPGENLAAKGVVVVTLNYRLNVFGYLSHSDFANKSNSAIANFGTLDQIMALRWVQRNIAAFQGNPNNITLFGESAGALAISNLMVSPLAKGLFHKAIMQSPYMPDSLHFGKSKYGNLKAGEFAEKLSKYAGLDSIVDLKTMAADELLLLSQKMGYWPEAVVDDYVLPIDVYRAFENGSFSKIPIIVGTNRDEVRSFSLFGLTPEIPNSAEEYRRLVQEKYGRLTSDYLALYPFSTIKDSVMRASTDAYYGWAAESFAKSVNSYGQLTYLYEYSHVSPLSMNQNLGAFHASELPYLFGSSLADFAYEDISLFYQRDPKAQKMSDVLMSYWTSFAKNSIPSLEGGDEWRAYSTKDRAYMEFKGGEAESKLYFRPGMFDLHDAVVKERRKNGHISWELTEVGLFSPSLSETKSESK